MKNKMIKGKVVGTCGNTWSQRCHEKGLDPNYVEQDTPTYSLRELQLIGLENPQREIGSVEIKSLEQNIMRHSPQTPMPKEEWEAFVRMCKMTDTIPFFSALLEFFGSLGEGRVDVQLRVMELNEYFGNKGF